MDDETKAAIVHMLMAMQQQITATLRLLTAPGEAPVAEKPKPRFFGESQTEGKAA